MSTRKVTFTPAAPSPVGPFSQAVIAPCYGPLLHLSGQLGRDPKSGQLVNDSVESEVRQAFTNLQAVVQSSGASMNSVIKVNIYITDMRNFPIVNEVMKQFFQAPYPARSTVGVASLGGALIELDGVVQLG